MTDTRARDARKCVACGWTQDGGEEAHIQFIHPDRSDLIVVEQMGRRFIVSGTQPDTRARDALAALLKELDPLAVSMDDLAARLVAAGVRARIDPDRLARALHAVPTLCLAARQVMGRETSHADTDARLAAAIVKAYEEE